MLPPSQGYELPTRESRDCPVSASALHSYWMLKFGSANLKEMCE